MGKKITNFDRDAALADAKDGVSKEFLQEKYKISGYLATRLLNTASGGDTGETLEVDEEEEAPASFSLELLFPREHLTGFIATLTQEQLVRAIDDLADDQKALLVQGALQGMIETIFQKPKYSELALNRVGGTNGLGTSA